MVHCYSAMSTMFEGEVHDSLRCSRNAFMLASFSGHIKGAVTDAPHPVAKAVQDTMECQVVKWKKRS